LHSSAGPRRSSSGSAFQAARRRRARLDALPWLVAEPLADALGPRLADASALSHRFVSRRRNRNCPHAASRGHRDPALGSIPRGAERSSQVLAAIERSARLDGAEEVLSRLAPDLATGTALRRLEGDQALGERSGGALGRVQGGLGPRGSLLLVERAPVVEPGSGVDFEWATRIGAVASVRPPGNTAFWSLEACVGSEPFSVVAALSARGGRLGGTVACFSLQLQLPDGPWLGAARSWSAQ